MEFQLKFSKPAFKELSNINNIDRERIIKALKTDLVLNPGKDKALRGSWKNHYSYRVSNYRIIYQILFSEITIMVIKVGHRKDVYDG